MSAAPTETRIRAMVQAHFARIWAFLRRLGVPSEALDDATQQVFMVAMRRAEVIEAARELQYLQGVALRIAAEQRRSLRRRDARTAPAADVPPQPDELLDQKRAREQLDDVLDAMPFDLRTAFVLFELDDLSVPEIASLLEIPEGTASSRLRRAREEFRRRVVAIKDSIK